MVRFTDPDGPVAVSSGRRARQAHRSSRLTSGLVGLAVVVAVSSCGQQQAGSSGATAPTSTGASTATGHVIARSDPGGVVSVRSDRRIQLSRNGGATYTTLPALPAAPADIQDVAAGPTSAYIAAIVSGRPRVWTTSDGGAAWAPVTLTPPAGASVGAGAVRLVMNSGVVAGLLVRAQSSSNFVISQWYEAPTTTASTLWTGHVAANVATVTAASGGLWAVTGPLSSGLAESTDGGTTWAPVSLQGCTTVDAALAVLGASSTGGIVVAVTTATTSGATWKTCSRQDSGAWSASQATDVTAVVGPGVSLPSSLAGATAVMATPDGSRVVTAQPAGTTASTNKAPTLLSTNGLPSGVSDLSAASATSLTAVVTSDQCPDGTKTSCQPATTSYTSKDGGQTWQPMTSA